MNLKEFKRVLLNQQKVMFTMNQKEFLVDHKAATDAGDLAGLFISAFDNEIRKLRENFNLKLAQKVKGTVIEGYFYRAGQTSSPFYGKVRVNSAELKSDYVDNIIEANVTVIATEKNNNKLVGKTLNVSIRPN